MADASNAATHHNGRNLTVVGVCVAAVVAMAGLTYAAVPLYGLFSQFTGYQGATELSSANTKGIVDRQMGLRFDATVSRGLPITVKAPAESFDKIGTERTVTYTVTNTSAQVINLTSSYNVMPDLTGAYFNRIRGFAKGQTLQPGQTVKVPVTFFVDPDLARDKNLSTVKEMTLSYTFYAADNGGR